MEYTKKDVLKKLAGAYKQCCVENKTTDVALSSVVQKAGFKPDEENTIFTSFGLSGYDEILEKSGYFEVFSPQGKTHKIIRRKQTVSKPAPVSQLATKSETSLPLHDRIKLILSYLNQNLYGKEEAVRLALLSAVAGESIFFMGPPGTAKSMVSRRIAAAFSDFYKDGVFRAEHGGYFEYLMNEFSTPDEICGPVDLSALNEKPSRYERQTAGYLPSAKVAFLDEIWKSGPAILNTLLTIINEKKFHNGSKVEKVPLVSLTSASNELPEKNRGLEALWDRFILRVFVNPVANEDDFFKVVDDGNNSPLLTAEQKNALLTISDVESWQKKINAVELSEEVKAVITAIRKELALLNADDKHKGDEAYYVSDRRWKKIVHILKTSAFLNGRAAVDLMDCSLIEYAIWNTDRQHDEVSGIVEKILGQNGIGKLTAIDDISDQIEEFTASVDRKWFDEIHVPAVAGKPAEEIIKKINNEDCYECTKDGTSEIWYVGVNPNGRYNSSYHNRYDSNGRYCDCYNFTKKNDTISCGYDFTVNKTKAVADVPAKDYLEAKLFEPVAKRTALEVFDREKYTPVLDYINSEIADMQSFRNENEKPFVENAFADSKRYAPILLSKIDESINVLEDKRLKLQEQHERYASDSNVTSNLSLGTIILKDGTTKTSGKDVERTDIIANVCMFGESEEDVYGISYEGWGGITFEEAKKTCLDYKPISTDADTQTYNSAWNIPTIEQWEKIYQNRERISHLEHPFAGRYWSSSVTENGAVYCFDFDKGERDYTTPDHTYNVYLIRKLSV